MERQRYNVCVIMGEDGFYFMSGTSSMPCILTPHSLYTNLYLRVGIHEPLLVRMMSTTDQPLKMIFLEVKPQKSGVHKPRDHLSIYLEGSHALMVTEPGDLSRRLLSEEALAVSPHHTLRY